MSPYILLFLKLTLCVSQVAVNPPVPIEAKPQPTVNQQVDAVPQPQQTPQQIGAASVQPLPMYNTQHHAPHIHSQQATYSNHDNNKGHHYQAHQHNRHPGKFTHHQPHHIHVHPTHRNHAHNHHSHHSHTHGHHNDNRVYHNNHGLNRNHGHVNHTHRQPNYNQAHTHASTSQHHTPQHAPHHAHHHAPHHTHHHTPHHTQHHIPHHIHHTHASHGQPRHGNYHDAQRQARQREGVGSIGHINPPMRDHMDYANSQRMPTKPIQAPPPVAHTYRATSSHTTTPPQNVNEVEDDQFAEAHTQDSEAAEDSSIQDPPDKVYSSESESESDLTSDYDQYAPHKINSDPMLHSYGFIHEAMSMSHAVMCIVCYAVLITKVTKDKTALGISLQSLTALTFSEVISILTSVYMAIAYKMKLDLSFYLVDVTSGILAFYCLFVCCTRFNNTIEDQFDTFGLNLCNRCLLYMKSPLIDSEEFKRGKKAGHLRPIGYIGTCILKSYWSVLYIIAIPIMALFMLIKDDDFSLVGIALTYDDAIRAIALIPQLYMFHAKSPRKISEQLAVFVLCEFLLKFLALSYWLSMPLFRFYVHDSRGYNIAVQAINLIALVDFVYYFFKTKLRLAKASDNSLLG